MLQAQSSTTKYRTLVLALRLMFLRPRCVTASGKRRRPRFMMPSRFAGIFALLILPTLIVPLASVRAFEWSAGSSARPEVNRKAIAGIWKLTPILQQSLPMKEFTVYPKKPPMTKPVPPELLLLLKEDGSFQKYDAPSTHESIIVPVDGTETSSNTDIDSSWRKFQNKQRDEVSQNPSSKMSRCIDFIRKGTWAFLDGNLILAADRPDASAQSTRGPSYSALADGTIRAVSSNEQPIPNRLDEQGMSRSVSSTFSETPKEDTLLKGRVVANYQTRLDDNPILSSTNLTGNALSTPNKIQFDTHLSVPRGSINVGKFFYPKHHPSFFEQPMFQPVKTGSFALRQILGNLNTAHQDSTQEVVEKFQRSDFYNKTFLLTSHPLRSSSSPKGKKRWSIKHNDYVYDSPPSKKPAVDLPTSAVRVLQVAFHANNTFSTTGGLGGAAILRGKFDIVGTEKDHLWMQVIRFGFGRSVSGSVYSEGPMLSHEDIKAYWGSIQKITQLDGRNQSLGFINRTADVSTDLYLHTKVDDQKGESTMFRIEVEGSVLDGLGLEPMPVGRFILKEIDPTSQIMEEDEEDEEEEEDDSNGGGGFASLEFGDDGIDWSSRGDESFQ